MASAKNSTYKFMMKLGAQVDQSFGKATKKAGGLLGKLGATGQKVVKAAAVGLATLSAATAAFSVSAVKSAMTYEKQLANVSTLLTGSESEIAARTSEIGAQILKISNETGTTTADLSEGMYQVISAFGDSKEAADILGVAAKSAAAGNATTTDSINLLSAVTKGYGDVSAEAVQKAADLSFATVRLGQTSFPELAANMGKVIPLASTLKVKQEELFGAMATLTGVTGSTAEVSTQLKATMQSFLSPSDKMTKALKALGYSSGAALLESEGLQGALEALKGAVNGDELAFAEMFSSVEAKNAVLAMAGAQAGSLAEKTAEMYKATGAANKAFDAQTNSLEYDIQMIKNLGANFKTQVGQTMLPVVRDVVSSALPLITKGFEKLASALTDKIIPAVKSTAGWISEHKGLIIALTAVVVTLVTVFKTYSAIMAIVNAVTAANPIVIIIAAIVAGIAILTGVIVALVKNWDKVKVGAVALWTKIKEVFANIRTAVTDAVTRAVEAFKNAFPLLSAYIGGWFKSIGDAWNNIKAIFTNIIDFVKNVFAGNWSEAWENIKNIFANVFGALANVAKAPINGIISVINHVLEKVNGISIKIPEWVPFAGGKTLGFDIPTIPLLAKGGIATAPTLATVGEGKEPEAILPLSKLAAMLRSRRGEGGGGKYPPPRDGDTVNFSPVFNFYGKVTKEEAEEAGRLSFAEFKRLFKQMKDEERRRSFEPADAR